MSASLGIRRIKNWGWLLIIFIVHGTLLTHDVLIRHYLGLRELIYEKCSRADVSILNIFYLQNPIRHTLRIYNTYSLSPATMVSEGTSMFHYTIVLNKKYKNYSLSLHVTSLSVSTIQINKMNISYTQLHQY